MRCENNTREDSSKRNFSLMIITSWNDAHQWLFIKFKRTLHKRKNHGKQKELSCKIIATENKEGLMPLSYFNTTLSLHETLEQSSEFFFLLNPSLFPDHFA